MTNIPLQKVESWRMPWAMDHFLQEETEAQSKLFRYSHGLYCVISTEITAVKIFFPRKTPSKITILELLNCLYLMTSTGMEGNVQNLGGCHY